MNEPLRSFVVVLFGSLNMIGLGIIGYYVWRAYETVEGRPGAIPRQVVEIPPRAER